MAFIIGGSALSGDINKDFLKAAKKGKLDKVIELLDQDCGGYGVFRAGMH